MSPRAALGFLALVIVGIAAADVTRARARELAWCGLLVTVLAGIGVLCAIWPGIAT
jgi:hypothetical protein